MIFQRPELQSFYFLQVQHLQITVTECREKDAAMLREVSSDLRM